MALGMAFPRSLHGGKALVLVAAVVLAVFLTSKWHGSASHRVWATDLDRDAAPGTPLHVQLPVWWRPSPRCGTGSCLRTASPEHLAAVEAQGTSNKTFFSQFGEDRYLYDSLFYGKANGTFIEMGAMNGVTFSNSLFFARQLGWVGLLIEAAPIQMPRLIQSRQESICLNSAVCSDFRTVHYWEHTAYRAVSGIQEFLAPKFKETWFPENTSHPLGHSNLRQVSSIPCVPMQYLLDRFDLRRIDFWSLDVEGAELEVLKTVDFSRTRVSVICVELDGNSPEKDEGVIALLHQNGFREMQRIELSVVYVHSSFVPSARR